jgi:hypothetical protein
VVLANYIFIELHGAHSSRDLGAIDSDSNYFSGGETERGESKLSHYSERKLSDSSSSSDTSCPVSKLSADTNYFSDSNFSDSYSVTTERRQIYECRYSRSVLETTPQRLGGQESNNSSQYSNNSGQYSNNSGQYSNNSCQYSNNSCSSDNNSSHSVNNNVGLPANNNSSSRSGNNNTGNSNRSANNSRHSTNNSSYSRSTIISSLSANSSSPEVERGDVISTHSNRKAVKLSSAICEKYLHSIPTVFVFGIFAKVTLIFGCGNYFRSPSQILLSFSKDKVFFNSFCFTKKSNKL